MAQQGHIFAESRRIQVKITTLKLKNSHSSPQTNLVAEKLKKSFRFALATSGVSIVLLTPMLVSAGGFSFPNLLSSLTRQTEAAGSSYNSQTVPLLASAHNIDPSPSMGGGDITVVGGSALLSEEGPSGTAADVETALPSATAISVYTVHKGDTLSSIAKMFKVTTNTIVWANNVSVIHEGDQLVILPITGVRYTILKGDTIAGVAKKFKADAGEVAQYNDLASDAVLTAGETIIIPNGEVPPTAAQVAQSARSKTIKNIASGKKTEPYLGGGGPALSGYFAWPVAGGVITQGLHGWNGIDIGAPSGTSIFAAAGGTVLVARSGGGWNGGYGNYVVVAHSNGTQTLYAHMSKVLVSPGASVSQGDTIGKIGSTGASTGPHLHFEVRGAANPFAN